MRGAGVRIPHPALDIASHLSETLKTLLLNDLSSLQLSIRSAAAPGKQVSWLVNNLKTGRVLMGGLFFMDGG
ncbi:MAG: hypothetical protein DRN06_08155 [Thermoprotei archaeon]|nr:MAG: hypothetical protein DRN06_08155 [Thermoprotei archaeon]